MANRHEVRMHIEKGTAPGTYMPLLLARQKRLKKENHHRAPERVVVVNDGQKGQIAIDGMPFFHPDIQPLVAQLETTSNIKFVGPERPLMRVKAKRS